MAGFVCSKDQGVSSGAIDNDNDNDNNSNEETITDDISTALKKLDTLLTHLQIGGQSLSANEFVEMDADIPAFNEWNDSNDNLIIINEECSNKNNDDNNEEDDIPTEAPPTLVDAMEMVRRLHLLASTQQPQLHSLISQLDSQLTQLFIDSKGLKQTKIHDFFHKN